MRGSLGYTDYKRVDLVSNIELISWNCSASRPQVSVQSTHREYREYIILFPLHSYTPPVQIRVGFVEAREYDHFNVVELILVIRG